MLAAAPKSPSRSNLFRLALSLSSNNEEAPATLVEYFDVVLGQAKQLSLAPGSLNSDVVPEAIDLAFQIKSNEHLLRGFMDVDGYTALSPRLAATLLDQLESCPVY